MNIFSFEVVLLIAVLSLWLSSIIEFCYRQSRTGRIKIARRMASGWMAHHRQTDQTYWPHRRKP